MLQPMSVLAVTLFVGGVFAGGVLWRIMSSMNSYTSDLEVVLKDARRQFLDYEQQHRAKRTEDADKKADVNAEMAMRITEVLGDY